MRALLGEHSFHDRVSKFFRTKATPALSKKPQRVARGETVEKVCFGGKSPLAAGGPRGLTKSKSDGLESVAATATV